jgi:hypothetical protein
MLALEKVPEDGKLTRLTVIGPAEQRAAFEADWKSSPELAPLKGHFCYTSYDPAHWHVAKYGFVTNGKPTIYVQQPDGKVLARMDDYPGAARFAQALRRVRPDYDPSKDRPTPGPATPADTVPLGALTIVGGAVGLAYALARFLTRRREDAAP